MRCGLKCAGLLTAMLTGLLAGCGAIADYQRDAIGCPTGGEGFTGRVVDADSGKPIAGAQVRTRPRTDMAQTEVDGCFRITADVRADDKSITPGSYTLDIELRDDDVTLAGEPTNAIFTSKSTDPVQYGGEAISLGIIRIARADRPESHGMPGFSPTSNSGSYGPRPE